MPIAAYYFALCTAMGVLIPYLPPYLKAQGLSGAQIGMLGALTPALSLLAPPVWGFFADRLQAPERVLRIAAAGAALAFAPMLAAHSFLAVALVLAAYAAFATTLSPLTDTIAMVEARRIGTDYPRLRLWGSLGYVASSSVFGILLALGVGAASVIPAVLVLTCSHAVMARFLPHVPEAPRRPTLRDAGRLASDPRLLLFLGGAMVHWAAAAPFHQFYAIHLRDLGVRSSFVGIGVAAAVGAEVLVMARFRYLVARVPLFAILGLAYAAGALRWLLTAQATTGPALAALQLLHGLSYGAFFVGSMAHLERSVPPELRATGRALFSAVVFGLGGIAGMLAAGALYDAGGGALAFRAAAGLELLSPLGLLVLRPRGAEVAVRRAAL